MKSRHMTGTVITAILFVLFLWAQGGAAEKNAKDYWKQGTRDADSKLYTDAINNFTRAIKTNRGEISIQDVSKIFNERGMVYMELKRYDNAAGDFENAVRLDDRNSVSHYNLGRVAVLEDRSRDAYEHFSAAIRLDPRNAQYYADRARVAMENREYGTAADDYTRVLVHDQTQGMAYYYRGIAFKNLERYEEALRDFDRVIERYPKSPDGYYQKAAIFSIQKKIDSACVLLEEAVKNGYTAWTALRNSREFDAIRKTDCYQEIMRGK